MDGFWMILELEPTRDISAIKQAYARKTRSCHPKEDSQSFLELRKAYQAALAYAEKETDGLTEAADQTDAGGSDNEGAAAIEIQGVGAADEGWILSDKSKRKAGPSPYADHEAVRSFLELYTGRQRKDQKRWLDYFTSDAFLDVAWNPLFTALLLEHVTRLEGEYPVNREFLIWLCAAYQFTVSLTVCLNPDGSVQTQRQLQIRPEARFEGQESVFEIVGKGPWPKQPKGNELAVFESFTEYRRLISMAEENIWSEREIGECSRIIGCYVAGYITDKCRQQGDVDCERHPAGLKLVTHFFRREGLPDELYRIAWQRLDLETAVMGRAKILYGALRELALERLPELAREQREKFTKLRADYFDYAVSTCRPHGENARATQEEIQKTDEFFAREDFQRAMQNRRFVEEEMLHTWVDEDKCDYYLKKVIQFYTEHETAPCARQVADRAREMLKYQEIVCQMKKDREAEISEDAMTLKNGPFFRHWLNTGFYQARDPESGHWLSEYLNQELPYLPEWSKRFLEVTEEGISPKAVTCALGEDTLEVCFHLRYMEFLLSGQPVYRACLEWERVAGLTDTDEFFFCLPVTVTSYDRYETVKEEILRRLPDTAAPEDGRSFIAVCLADQVCGLPLPGEVGLAWDMDEEEMPEALSLPPESVLPFELFAEDTEHLYVCEWIERSQVLLLSEQLPIGRQRLKGGQADGVADAQSAAALARQMLEETLAPSPFPMELLVNLPDAVYAEPDLDVVCRDEDKPLFWSRPVELLGESVTSEKLEELLTWFAGDGLDRLELSWNITAPIGEELDYDARRSLVFLKGGGGYACLYFDDFRAKSYALLEKPELYGNIDDNSESVPFRQSRLFHQVIHQSFSSIRRRLDVIFGQVSWPGNVGFMAGRIWDYAVYVSSGRAKYNLDKQLLAGFPMERAHNRPDAPFYFYFYPASVCRVDDQGGVETLEIVQWNRGRMQQMLIGFLKGGFRRLRLTWRKEPGRRQHIVLLQDGGRFLMAWLQEETRTARYHVADMGTYMDVEEKKYPRDIFQGRSTPAYLIHDGVTPLRNALELLLANWVDPDCVTERSEEYTDEKLAEPRSYEALWEELVGDTLSDC